jgi:hypothetical protein
MAEKVDQNATGPIPEKNAEGTNYVIAIGISEYDVYRLKLRTPVHDCIAFTKILQEKYGFTLFDKILSDKNATKTGILEHFDKFKELNTTSADSLFIFYSGHGFLYQIKDKETNELTDEIGCWIPVEGTRLKPDKLLKVQDVIDKIKELPHLKHIVIISDCCTAGSILEVPSFYNLNGQLSRDSSTLDETPSRWAICSSRSDEASVAAKGDKLSRFTKALVEELENNSDPRILLSLVATKIKNDFDKKSWQKPFISQLALLRKNGGEFTFKASRQSVVIKKRENFLFPALYNLNYNHQFAIHKKMETMGKVQFAIFSGLPSCGLNFISHRIRKKIALGADLNPVTQYQFTGLSPDEKVLNGLREALSINDAGITLEGIKTEILNRLKNGHVVIIFRFQIDSEDTDGSATGNMKRELLDCLGKSVGDISNKISGVFRLYIFVLDFELFDYGQLYSQNNIGGIDTTYIPRTQPILIEELCAWYEVMENRNFAQDDKLIEFKTLFDDAVNKKLTQFLDETKGYPGSTLLKICEAAECNDLAIKIQDPEKI